MQRKYPMTPTLGWSVSRYDKFNICKRQYYYDYYAKYDREVSLERISALKTQTSIPLEIGNLVHDTIAALLHRLRKTTDPIDTENVLGYSKKMVDRAIQNKIFSEVYYGKLQEIDSDGMKERVVRCMETFFHSEWYPWLLCDAVEQKSAWIIEPNDYGEIRINGFKAYCKVDFLFPVSDQNFFIMDWKTGKVDTKKHVKQMKGYVLYAKDICNVTSDHVRPLIAYLGSGYQEIINTFGDDELDEFILQIGMETKEMYQYCENIDENIPKSKAVFAMQSGRACNYCNYKELCGL